MQNNFVLQIYTKSLEKLKAQVKLHNPDSINVMLDGWSAFHHGYMGVIMSKTTCTLFVFHLSSFQPMCISGSPTTCASG